MLETLTAFRFEKEMTSGRTRPCLLTCVDNAGNEIEVVAKLKGNAHANPSGLLCEAFTALLALDLELPVQKPYLVEIEKDFAATIQDTGLRQIFANSLGQNFGTENWGHGFSIWPPMKQP
jgi:hypothetical protein